MPDGMPFAPSSILAVCLAFLAAGCVATLILVAKARRTIGEPIAVERPSKRVRRMLLLGAQAIVLTVVAIQGDLPLELVVPCMLLAAAIVILAPGFKDALCGETGVQRGWYARRFENLEEWRMTGEHLRFRLFGEWTSVPLPAPAQPKIREKLLQLCPTRESRFKD